MPAAPLHLLVIDRPIEYRFPFSDRLPGDVDAHVGSRIEEFEDFAPTADILLSWFAKPAVLQAVFARARHLRWLHSASVGVDNLLFPALVESPVPVTNARGAYSDSLAEFVLGAMLFFAKNMRRMIRSQAAGQWDRFDVEMLQGKVLAIVGYGGIGRAVAERARAFGMRVFALRRRLDLHEGDLVDRVFPRSRFADMLAEADYVVAALPLTPETRYMIGTEELAAMKSTAVLINVGRGPVVHEPALVAALEQKRILGAALDVFEHEPLPAGHPFYQLENVLLSPHTADHTAGWLEASYEIFLHNLERFRKGEPLQNMVDKHSGY